MFNNSVVYLKSVHYRNANRKSVWKWLMSPSFATAAVAMLAVSVVYIYTSGDIHKTVSEPATSVARQKSNQDARAESTSVMKSEAVVAAPLKALGYVEGAEDKGGRTEIELPESEPASTTEPSPTVDHPSGWSEEELDEILNSPMKSDRTLDSFKSSLDGG